MILRYAIFRDFRVFAEDLCALTVGQHGECRKVSIQGINRVLQRVFGTWFRSALTS